MTDYSREAPRDVLQAFNPAVPNVARIYDFLLGGKDNYAADREAAARLLDAVPGAAAAARDNRRFLGGLCGSWPGRRGYGSSLISGPGCRHAGTCTR